MPDSESKKTNKIAQAIEGNKGMNAPNKSAIFDWPPQEPSGGTNPDAPKGDQEKERSNVPSNDSTNEGKNDSTNEGKNESTNDGTNESTNDGTKERTNDETKERSNERKNEKTEKVIRKRQSVDLKTDLYKQFKRIAVDEDLNVYEMIEEAMEQWLKRWNQRKNK